MSIQTPTNDQESTTTQTQAISDDMSFADYERMRRGETIAVQKESAPEATAPEQKELPESETEETEDESELEDESTESESDEDEGKEEESATDKPKKKSGFQRRIDKLNARIAEREREAQYWRDQATKKEADAPKTEKSAAKVEAEGKPSPEHFETHEEYVEALTDWKIDQKEKAKEQTKREAQLKEEQEKTLKSHSSRVKSFAEKTKDFDDVIDSVADVPLTAAIQEAIISSDVGPELMYELSKNRAELERIVQLSPIAAARELGKIESKIASRASEEKKPEPKKLTSAPKPLAPIGNGKAGQSKSLDDPELSFAEYEKLRREQLRKRG